MAKWSVRLAASLDVLRDGERATLRVRQQALLLAWLAIHAPEAVERAETAALLWPDASRENALAYLRRAVMEIRKLGIDVTASRSELAIGESVVECDLMAGADEALLMGIDSPVADRIRRIAAKRRKRLASLTPAVPEDSASGAEAALVAGLLRERPDVALEVIARVAPALGVQRPPAEVLALCQRALDASAEETHARATVLMIAARSAMFLTRYGLAERHFAASGRIARLHGDEALAIKVLTMHCFMLMETRRWGEALEMGRRAVEAAELLGDPELAAHAHVSLAGIQWHRLDFQLAAEHYRVVERISPIERPRVFARTNLAYLWAVFGVPFDAPDEVPPETDQRAGYDGGLQAFELFSLHLGSGKLGEAAKWAANHLDLTAAEGQERYICVSLDCAAILFGNAGMTPEAAATVRLGSRLRRSLGHRRSPAEALAIRRHVEGGFFAPEAATAMGPLNDVEPTLVARRVVRRLRLAAISL